MSHQPVLIVGAGPTGLVLALWLTHLKIPVRLIDRASEPGTTSRALAVQARTLELYRQIHLAGAVVERGQRVQAASFWALGKRRATAVFGELGATVSPYSFALTFPQDEHERLLIDRLAKLGVTVERSCELASFEESAAGVRARVHRAGGGEETIEAAFIAGCDGAHSAVRTTLGIGFEGGTYAHLFYVADVQAAGAVVDGNLHVALDTTDFLAVFALRRAGAVRLVGAVRGDPAQSAPERLSWNDVHRQIMEWLPIEVERVNWFSTYRVHHRVAAHFRRGRAFLLGDAAHVHSPVGGQGMNTGIGDAVNLAWKLAAVLTGQAPASILDSYEPERIAFARRLVRTTDRAFSVVTSPSLSARLFRLHVFPRLLATLIKTRAMRNLMFRTVSQTALNYRGGALSLGRAGAVHGGDRLPWLPLDGGTDNYAALESLQWQVHVYGEPPAPLASFCRDRSLALHAFPWRAQWRKHGVARDALYLVRPDGYVGFAAARADVAALAAYLDERGLAPLDNTALHDEGDMLDDGDVVER
jgi:2-polyprenyl-6-methoxyphenol hydroxylase-like FAD-dependent oxidoreductase